MNKPVNPIHGKPLWGLVRLANDPDIDQEIMDNSPHLAFMFSDTELIAMRVLLTGALKCFCGDEDFVRTYGRLADHAETGLEKLKSILNAELEESEFLT